VLTELPHSAQCAELVLDSLPEAAVAASLPPRLGPSADLAAVLLRHTSGYPVFLVSVVDE
jgi:hypothetical protein